MDNNGIQIDELVELLNDKSAPTEKYREVLSKTESGQLYLPTGFDSVIAELENKVSFFPFTI